MLTGDENLNKILFEIEKRIRELFGEKVSKIILFGSFARGDYNADSDVDIIVLVNDDNLYKYRKSRVKIICEYLEKHNILLSVRIVEADKFFMYKDTIPFYQNIINQGISLYG